MWIYDTAILRANATKASRLAYFETVRNKNHDTLDSNIDAHEAHLAAASSHTKAAQYGEKRFSSYHTRMSVYHGAKAERIIGNVL